MSALKTIKPFVYHYPTTIEDALSELASYNGNACLLSGGTDLILMMKLWLIAPEAVISLKNVCGMKGICKDDSFLRIGALTTLTDLHDSELIKNEFYAIYDTTVDFSTPQIRNVATIGGNICRSSPCADGPPPLITLGAKVRLIGPEGERMVLLENFFTGPGSNVMEGEILVEVLIPLPSTSSGSAYMALARNTSDISKVTCAVTVTVNENKCSEVMIVMGAVAPKIVRAKQAEIIMKGQEIDDLLIQNAAESVVHDISPISDVRSEANYRREVSKVLVNRTIKQAIKRALQAEAVLL